MFKWGETQLRVVVGSYEGPYPALSINEIGLLPVSTDVPASALQTGGRLRKRAKVRILLDTMDEYHALYSDYMLSQVRVLELKDGVTLASAMISSFSPPLYDKLWVVVDVEFLEV